MDDDSSNEKLEKFLVLFNQYNHFDRHEDLTFKITEPGDIYYYLTIQEKHLSSPGVAHGGTISAMMDATLGLAALTKAFTQNNICSTIEFKMNFLNPAKLGDELEGHGQIVFKGSSIIVAEAQIIQIKDQKMIAKGIGTFNLYPFSKKAKFYDIP